jgi:hypothetical protein
MISRPQMFSKENLVIDEVAVLLEFYSINTKFFLIRLDLEKNVNFTLLHLFQRLAKLPTASRNIFLGTGAINDRS